MRNSAVFKLFGDLEKGSFTEDGVLYHYTHSGVPLWILKADNAWNALGNWIGNKEQELEDNPLFGIGLLGLALMEGRPSGKSAETLDKDIKFGSQMWSRARVMFTGAKKVKELV
jgi:hypothetical protein